jgi:NAD-dependent deacetylase
MLDPAHLQRISAFIESAGQRLLFLAIGTSGTVHPAAGLVDDVAAVGGRSWLIDADPPASYAARFNRVITGKSGEVLPGLV